MLFVVRYPDRPKLIEPLTEFAREELEHFQAVYRIVAKRGLKLAPDVPDEYAGRLLKLVRGGRDERLLDRLLCGAILEARGCERFGLLANALEDDELRELYRGFTRADARHQRLFVDLARHYFDEDVIVRRATEMLSAEASFVRGLPVRPALY